MAERVERHRIHSHMTRSRFLHVEDALDIGKVRLFGGEYIKGEGAKTLAVHYLDVADARVLLNDLAWGKPVDYCEFKGTCPVLGPWALYLSPFVLGPKDQGSRTSAQGPGVRQALGTTSQALGPLARGQRGRSVHGNGGDEPRSRVLKVRTNGDKTWFRLENGPGEVVGEGAVKPAGEPEAVVDVPFTLREARRLAFAVLAHLDAWEAVTFWERTGREGGDASEL